MTIPQLMPWIGGPVKFEAGLSPLVCPIDETVASQIIESDAKVVDAAVKHAHAAFLKHQDATTAKRVEWLLAAAEAIDKIEGELVHSLIRFIGKPRRAATFEAKRVGTFIRACAAQVPHLMGEVLPLDVTAAGAGRFGFTTRVPYGVVAAVTPFNGPANLLIQKVAPALAVGNAVVAKPSPPGTEVALLMAQAVKTAGVPDGLFNVVPGGRETAKLLAAHPLVAVVTVTGSTAAGNELARAAGAKKFIGELGSNAANIVCADADLNDAATRIAGAAFEASGQQCISAQRVIVERPVFDRFLELFVAAAKKLKVGDPDDAAIDVGPMVSSAAADRVEAMVKDAVANGAKLVLEPERRGAILGPAIVANAPPQARLMRGRRHAKRRRCRRRARARELLRIRFAGGLLHHQPRDRVQGFAQAPRRLALDQRRQPLPTRHLSLRRRGRERLRARRRALRDGGALAMEVHGRAPQSAVIDI